DQVGIQVREEALKRRDQVARGEHPPAVRSGAAGKLVEPERWRLLQKRDVPLPLRDPAGELVAERPVHLDVCRVSLGYTQEPRAQREERAVGREVTPVVQIPAED